MPEPPPPVSALVRLQRAGVLLNAGRPSEAADEIRRGLVESPHDHGLLTVLAACHLELREPAKAREVAEECIRAEPNGCLEIVATILAFLTFFWTLLTIVAPEDLATPLSVAIQAGIWTVVGLLIWRIRVVRRRHRGWL